MENTTLVPAKTAATSGDLIALLLRDFRSAATRATYEADLRRFFSPGGGPAQADDVQAFISLTPPEIAYRLATYKSDLRERGLSEASVNRRLSAVRTLLKFSYRLGLSTTNGQGLVDNERVTPYRDTRGPDLAAMQNLLETPDQGKVQGLRDAALLRLFCENALRRQEVVNLNVDDFDVIGNRITILGKGRGTQKEPVTISPKTAAAISKYLLAAGHGADAAGPLFRSLHHNPAYRGNRLTAVGIYGIVTSYAEDIGVKTTVHGLRHGAITAALDKSGGDMRKVQKLSRHKNINTLLLYDDNRSDAQGEMTNLLSAFL